MLEDELTLTFQDDSITLPALYRLESGSVVAVRVVRRYRSASPFGGDGGPGGYSTEFMILASDITEPQQGEKIAAGLGADAIADLPADYWSSAGTYMINEVKPTPSGMVWRVKVDRQA